MRISSPNSRSDAESSDLMDLFDNSASVVDDLVNLLISEANNKNIQRVCFAV